MPVSPFEGDAARRPPADGQPEPRHAAAAQPEVLASPVQEPEAPGAEDTIEEPGYGHGV